MIFLFLIVLALIPSLFWLFIFLRKDDYEPEPLKLLCKIFILGVLIFVPIFFVEGQILDYFSTVPESVGAAIWVAVLSAFLVAAPVEEIAKYLAARTIVRRNRVFFNQAVDGIVYMVVAAAGFTFAEDLFYFWGQYHTAQSLGFSSTLVGGAVINIFLIRFTTGALHMAASGIFGYFWGLAWFKGEEAGTKYLVKGFIGAVLLHGLFNLSLDLADITGNEFVPLSIALTALGTAYVLFKFKRHELTAIHGVKGLEELPAQKPPHPATTALKVAIPVLLVAAFFMLVPGVNQRTGGASHYSVVAIGEDRAFALVETENLQQCQIVNEQSQEFYANLLEDTEIGGDCVSSSEATETFSPLFARIPGDYPYLAYEDWRGHETRVFVNPDFTDEERAQVLVWLKEQLEESKGIADWEFVMPRQ